MSAFQSEFQTCLGESRHAAARLVAGQVAVQDLRAHTAIVAVEGDLQLDFRDHSLAWLGDAVPVTSVTLREGERFVTPQRGVVKITATHACAAFVVQPCRTEVGGHGPLRQAARYLHHLASLVRTWLRSPV